ncbi:Protection of telomeres protein 1 [Phlyctema vagabunda]|uniref:Protection of telomeres protein 1 n=1 Tax=Phlyctema vagabunda TaxID=108571 RepID=A0ABR4P303_9HELO
MDQNDAPARALPVTFESIQDILGMSTDRLMAGSLVNVIGFARDFQPPFKTKGTDFKCTLKMTDISRQYESFGIELVIFRPEHKMPRLNISAADAILVRKVKVQMRNGTVSLLCSWTSEFHILSAESISIPPNSAVYKSWRSNPISAKAPSRLETDYVVWAHKTIDKSFLPSAKEFQDRSMQAMAVSDKFNLLQNVKEGGFYNVIGNVVKKIELGHGCLTMYLSDYTAHSSFYHYTWEGRNEPAGGVDGDEYGYLTHRPKATKEWPGPFGKLVIQITLYDQHADYVREHVKVDQWLMLRNLQVKYGKMGACLEGFLRGEREGDSGQIKVEIMEIAAEPDQNDERWKDAVRRKREWWEKFAKQKKEILEEAAQSGTKRKNDDEKTSKPNGKKRRTERRAAAQKKIADAEVNLARRLDVNEHVRCNNPDKQPLSLLEIKKSHLSKSDGGQRYHLPFVNCNYRADVRVVDFFPNKLQDFTIGRRPSEFDVLSDYSGGEDTDHEEDMRRFKDGQGFGLKKWEWRFALQVEDAGGSPSKTPKERMWLLVGHHDAQMLLGVDHATNLRQDPSLLSQIREKLCILWGDLEEQKLANLPEDNSRKALSPPSSSINSSVPSPPSYRYRQNPDPDSDVEEEYQRRLKDNVKRHADEERPLNSVLLEGPQVTEKQFNVKNKAFTCCIKQYGVKVVEPDVTKATAGNEQRWERMFGLHGTQIT